MDKAAPVALVLKPHHARYSGEEGIVFANPYVVPRLQSRPALADQNRTSRNELAVKSLNAQPLRVGVAAVA